jgi:hypothetical protein
MKRFSALVLLLAAMGLVAAPARADVTIKMTMSTTGGPMAMDMTSVAYIKGMKMRTDVKVMTQDMSIIVDVAAKQQLMVNHVTKQVETFDPQSAMANMPVSFGDISVAMKPSGETKEILGRTCTGFTMQLSMPMTLGDESFTMTMTGPVWIAKDAPGVAEYQAFYKAALAAGLSLSPLAQGPQSKGMAEMQRVIATNGIPLEQQLQFSVEGAGQMAQMMGTQMAGMAMVTKVTEISTDSIPDGTFVPPADYTKK